VEEVKCFEGSQKVPKQGFLDYQFDKWLHKATFWLQVSMLHSWKFFSFLLGIISQSILKV
jgi:hypothetical protein